MPASQTQDASSSAKSQQVLTELRSRIIDGQFERGSRLPTFDEMEAEFGVSRAVLQTAVSRLKKDGFVRSVYRRGLFVAEQPPHLTRYGIVFSRHPDQRWSRMDTALVNEAKRIERQRPDRVFKIYTGSEDEEGGKGIQSRILQDVKAHRLAGLILMPRTYHLIDDVARINAEFPVINICAAENWGIVNNVSIDRGMFYQRALARLVEKGARRVAVVFMADTTTGIDHASLFAEAGLKFREHWMQMVGRSDPETADRLVRLMMDYPAEQRPDGLLIADDNLIEPVSKGLSQTGIRVGEELAVVAHTNWPWPYSSALPMDRLGYSATDLLERALAAARTIHEGKNVPEIQFVPAQFEWEIEQPAGQPALIE